MCYITRAHMEGASLGTKKGGGRVGAEGCIPIRIVIEPKIEPFKIFL